MKKFLHYFGGAICVGLAVPASLFALWTMALASGGGATPTSTIQWLGIEAFVGFIYMMGAILLWPALLIGIIAGVLWLLKRRAAIRCP
ncbi:MAG TPA: hypothetical protein V6C89_15015 [Drouetiella sp.]